MRRLLLPLAAAVALAGLTAAPAYATLGSCVSLDTRCWDHECEDHTTVDRRVEASDTGPIVHVCV